MRLIHHEYFAALDYFPFIDPIITIITRQEEVLTGYRERTPIYSNSARLPPSTSTMRPSTLSHTDAAFGFETKPHEAENCNR
jgi:hypothetical protein